MSAVVLSDTMDQERMNELVVPHITLPVDEMEDDAVKTFLAGKAVTVTLCSRNSPKMVLECQQFKVSVVCPVLDSD